MPNKPKDDLGTPTVTIAQAYAEAENSTISPSGHTQALLDIKSLLEGLSSDFYPVQAADRQILSDIWCTVTTALGQGKGID
jgi:hypothetical protein